MWNHVRLGGAATLEVIPVLDLMGGQVVHARRGERDAYRPIQSSLVAGSDPLAIVAALLGLAPFRTLYIADLDAIRRRGSHDAVIDGLRAAFRDLEIWVDRGETDVLALRRRGERAAGVSVIGSESFSDIFALKRALAAGPSVLSLDHDASGRMGPIEIHESPKLWPDRVIVMTLARVGAGAGPDIERLTDVLERAEGRRVYAAGGVRDPSDLDALTGLGVAGVLVASALHDGRLDGATLIRGLAASRRIRPQP